MKSDAIISVMCNLVGMTKAGERATLTQAGWSKFDTANSTVYKNRIAYSVYSDKKDLDQYATITCWGERFKWAAENLTKGQCVFISGKLSIKPASDNGKSPFVDIEVTSCVPGPKRVEAAASYDDGDDTAGQAPAPARASARAPARQPAPAESDGDLPF